MKAIFVGILASMLMFGGCAITGTGRGAEFIEDLSVEQFDAIKAEVGLIVEIGTRELINHGQLKKEEVAKVAELINAAATATVSETAILAIGDSLSEYISNDTLASVLQVVELEIRRWGGFTVIRAEDGTLYLSDRSKELLLSLAQGLARASA